MFHVEIGVQLKMRPQQVGTIRIIPKHPGFDYSGSLRAIKVLLTEYPGGSSYSEDLLDHALAYPVVVRPSVEVWKRYAERFAERMTQKKWSEELRNATSTEATIVIPKIGSGGNF